MPFTVFKLFLSAAVIAFSSWLAKQRPELAGFIINLRHDLAEFEEWFVQCDHSAISLYDRERVAPRAFLPDRGVSFPREKTGDDLT